MSGSNPFDPKKFKDDLHEQIHRTIEDGLNCGEGKQGRPRRPMVIGIGLRRSGREGLIMGCLMALVGLAFLLDHLGVISIGPVWRFWPLLVVFAGVVNLLSRDHRLWGIFLMVAGVLLQLNQLGIVHLGWAVVWPMLLIAIGLHVIWRSLEGRKQPAQPPPATGDPRTTLHEAVVFGGLERRMTSQDFQGGDVTAMFGGVELDLTEAHMQANEATLAITAIFGGVELRVPPTWQVAFRGSPIFGGIEDKTRTARADNPASPDLKTLVVTGAVIFGGLEIKN